MDWGCYLYDLDSNDSIAPYITVIDSSHHIVQHICIICRPELFSSRHRISDTNLCLWLSNLVAASGRQIAQGHEDSRHYQRGGVCLAHGSAQNVSRTSASILQHFDQYPSPFRVITGQCTVIRVLCGASFKYPCCAECYTEGPRRSSSQIHIFTG